MTFHYDRISVKEGIDTETYKSHLYNFINETFSKKCNACCVLFHNKSNFNYRERTCDKCHKILLNIEFESKHTGLLQTLLQLYYVKSNRNSSVSVKTKYS